MTATASEKGLVAVVSADRVQTWEMNHPPANGIGPPLLATLHTLLTAAEDDASVSGIVISSGLSLFSAGADAKWMAEVAHKAGPEELLEEFIDTMESFRNLGYRFRTSPLLIVAAIDGHVVGGGLELAAACDLRFVSSKEEIKIGVPEMAQFGNMPSGGGGVQYLSRLMGASAALQLILTGEPIPPQAALQVGLVDRLTPPDAAADTAREFAVKVSNQAGRRGIAASKTAVFAGLEMPMAAALTLDRAVHWDAVRRGDFVTTVMAFVEKYGGSSS